MRSISFEYNLFPLAALLKALEMLRSAKFQPPEGHSKQDRAGEELDLDGDIRLDRAWNP